MKNIWAFALILSSLSSFAQSGMLRGFIKDKATDEAIPFGSVSLLNTDYGSVTNMDGYFQVGKLPNGEYDVQVSFMGYESRNEKITIKKGNIITRTYYLEKGKEVLDDIVLNIQRQQRKTKVLVSEIRLSQKSVDRFSVGGDADLVKAINVLPGVVATGDQGGQLYIRGGAPIQNLTMLDGMIVYNPFHSIGFFSVFDTDILQSADIFTAGFNAQYGSRNSSVMDIKTRSGNRQRFSGKVSASTFMAKALVEAPIGKKNKAGFANSSILLSAKASYLHETSSIFYPYVETVFDGLPFEFVDVFGKFSTQNNRGSEFNAFGFNFNDRVRFDADKDINWKSGGAGFNFKVVPSGSPTIIGGSFAFSNYAIESTEIPGQPRNSDISGFNGGLNFTYFIGKNDELKYGVEFIGYATDFVFTNSVGLKVSSANNTTEMAGFAKYRYVSDRIIIEPGLRLHYYGSLAELSFEPRLGFKFNATEYLRFKGSGGLYSQNLVAANSDRDVVNLFYGFLSGGNSNLPSQFRGEPVETKLQKATHLVGGFEVDIATNWDFSFETYIKDFHQIINTNRNKLYPDVPAYSDKPELLRLDYIVEKGKAYGFDFLLKYDDGTYYLWAVYSWSKVTRDDGLTVYSPHFDRRHNVNLVGAYKFGDKKSWEVSARWNFGSGFPFTPTQGYYPGLTFTNSDGSPSSGFDYTTENGNGSVLYGALNSMRLTDYHRLDVSVKKNWELSKYSTFLATLGATNIYNQENIFFFNRTTAEAAYQLPIMPYLSMSYSF